MISRSPRGWWQQLQLGKGSLQGIGRSDAVLGPGGLVGRIDSVTPATARVKLLTAPGHEIGVWLPRSRRHGLLVGRGNSRLSLRFIDKDPHVRPGDLVANKDKESSQEVISIQRSSQASNQFNQVQMIFLCFQMTL